MEINLNSNGFANVGLGTRIAGLDATAKAQDVKASKSLNVQASGLKDLDALHGSEPVADVPAAALSRDDALGKLVNSAFSLPPPPMPSFA